MFTFEFVAVYDQRLTLLVFRTVWFLCGGAGSG